MYRHFFLVLFVFVGCSNRATVQATNSLGSRVLHLVTETEPTTLQPVLASSSIEAQLASFAFDSLLVRDNDNILRPQLSTQIPTLANHEVSASGKSITFSLRHNVRWQDGSPFSAADVVFTFDAMRNPRNNVDNQSSLDFIESVVADGDYSVTFRLKHPQGSFFESVALIPIVPRHLLVGVNNLNTSSFNDHPIGTGPYRFVKWPRGDRIEYAANSEYFGGRPKIAHISVAIVPDSQTQEVMLRTHAIDFAAVESSAYNGLRDVASLKHSLEPLNDFVGVAMNEASPVLRDKYVRLAIVGAIDRVVIAKTASFGTGTVAYADLPLSMYGGRPHVGWDLANTSRAAGLLDSAGWKIGTDGIREKNGTPLRLDMIGFSGVRSAENAALQMQQMLHRVGIEIDYRRYAPAEYFAAASSGGPVYGGKFDLALFSFTPGSSLSNSYLYGCASRIPAGPNASNYCNPAMEDLQSKLNVEYDPWARRRIAAQIEDLAVHDAAYVFLYHTPYRLIMDPTLQRAPSSLDTPYYDIKDWTFRAQS